MPAKISASLIVKNEEALLADCLESVKEADEIVICDTGSTDKTVEIAKKYTDKVFEDYKWDDNFAEARNHCLKKCTGDWILTVDADEVLEPGGIEKARRAIAETEDSGISVRVVAKNNTNTLMAPRLYRNKPDIFWKGAIHNHLNIVPKATSDLKITYGYSPAHKDDPNRSMRILKKEAAKNPNSTRTMFYLGREYNYKKDWKNAIKWFKKQVKLEQWAPQLADGYYLLAYCYWHDQQGNKARDACLQAIKVNANFTTALELMAEMSGPKNRKRWLEFAQTSTNEGVLFTRRPAEMGAEYYDELHKRQDLSRFENLYKKIGEWVGDRSCLDIGCGTGELGKYIKRYWGFDISMEAVKNSDRWQGDAYDKENYTRTDVYVLCEVLEHLQDDYKVMQNIPQGKEVILSVPSFKDESHIRVFTEEVLRIRYRHYLEIEEVVRFNLDKVWVEGGEDTNYFILLARGKKL